MYGQLQLNLLYINMHTKGSRKNRQYIVERWCTKSSTNKWPKRHQGSSNS